MSAEQSTPSMLDYRPVYPLVGIPWHVRRKRAALLRPLRWLYDFEAFTCP